MIFTAASSHDTRTPDRGPLIALSGRGRLFAGLFCASVLPMLANVVFVMSGTTFGGIDPTPFALALGLVGLTWLICANQAADAATAAPARLDCANRVLESALAESQDRLDALSARCAELERELSLDPLTGVHNRRGLEAAFGAVMDQTGGDMVMALLDIDHFKKINDTFGHATGDRVLKDFARLLRARLNDTLPIYRVGGEEFVVLFPKTEMAAVAILLDKFRTDLQVDAFTKVRDRVLVSFSAGLALGRDTDGDFSDAFRLADDRLYAAKKTGRAKTIWQDAGAFDKVAAAG